MKKWRNCHTALGRPSNLVNPGFITHVALWSPGGDALISVKQINLSVDLLVGRELLNQLPRLCSLVRILLAAQTGDRIYIVRYIYHRLWQSKWVPVLHRKCQAQRCYIPQVNQISGPLVGCDHRTGTRAASLAGIYQSRIPSGHPPLQKLACGFSGACKPSSPCTAGWLPYEEPCIIASSLPSIHTHQLYVLMPATTCPRSCHAATPWAICFAQFCRIGHGIGMSSTLSALIRRYIGPFTGSSTSMPFSWNRCRIALT